MCGGGGNNSGGGSNWRNRRGGSHSGNRRRQRSPRDTGQDTTTAGSYKSRSAWSFEITNFTSGLFNGRLPNVGVLSHSGVTITAKGPKGKTMSFSGGFGSDDTTADPNDGRFDLEATGQNKEYSSTNRTGYEVESTTSINQNRAGA